MIQCMFCLRHMLSQVLWIDDLYGACALCIVICALEQRKPQGLPQIVVHSLWLVWMEQLQTLKAAHMHSA